VRVVAVTAVHQERDAVARGAGIAGLVRVGPYSALTGTTAGGDELRVVAAGVGPAAASAAAMAGVLDGADALLSLGLAGAYRGLPQGAVVIADTVVAADVGAASEDRFLDLAELGLGPSSYPCAPRLVELLQESLGAAGIEATVGRVLTLASATGTDARAAELMARHRPVAEAMEGAGVAHVAALVGVPMLELRTISNAVGRRDMLSWDIPRALAALEAAAAAIFAGRVASH
jgi:futalosine hydrolase